MADTVLDNEMGFGQPADTVVAEGGYGYEKIPRIDGDEEFDKIEPGKIFTDPSGNRRQKPYTVRDEREFEALPEGAQFIDPDGNLRQKPKYEGVDYTANTLYNMAANDKERRHALERSYPGKIRGEKA